VFARANSAFADANFAHIARGSVPGFFAVDVELDVVVRRIAY
jgi:hypothetical protein